MFAFLAPVDQPYVNGLPISVYPKSSGIDKFLLLPATSAASVYSDTRIFALIHSEL